MMRAQHLENRYAVFWADDVMETSLTIDYDKQWLNCVSAIGPMSFGVDVLNSYSLKCLLLQFSEIVFF